VWLAGHSNYQENDFVVDVLTLAVPFEHPSFVACVLRIHLPGGQKV